VIKVKICGLTRQQDIDIVNVALPDYIGFVFAESRRKVLMMQAAAMKQNLDRRVSAVGVFVNHDPAEIERIAGNGIIELIQLHGDEDAAYITCLKKKTGLPIMKAVRVRCREQILEAQAMPCEFLLLDTYQEGAYGGTGKTFDRALIPPLEKPFFLAGGLNAENIKKALAVRPCGVDISGGVETDGVKDAEKIKEIIRIVREEN
jgi:phosphoribosylanthranilate isomerase